MTLKKMNSWVVQLLSHKKKYVKKKKKSVLSQFYILQRWILFTLCYRPANLHLWTLRAQLYVLTATSLKRVTTASDVSVLNKDEGGQTNRRGLPPPVVSLNGYSVRLPSFPPQRN